MARPLKEIEQELLNLPQEEQARLAHALIVSLDAEEDQLSEVEWEAIWLEEAQRRNAEVERGEAQPIPADEVMRRAYDVLKKNKK